MKKKLLFLFILIPFFSHAQAVVQMNPDSCDGSSGSVEIVSGGIDYDSYQWFLSLSASDNFQQIPFQNGATLNFDWATLDHRYIKVFVTYGPIEYFSNTIYLNSGDCNLNVPEHDSLRFTLYPNPADGTLMLSATTSLDWIKIYNSLGEIILNKRQTASFSELDISTLPKGIYFLSVKSEEKIETIKFLKR